MIFECRVYAPDMKLKKVITQEEMLKRHWEDAMPDIDKMSGMKVQEVYHNNCGTCGAPFETKIRTAKYCGSRKCKTKREYERRYGEKK